MITLVFKTPVNLYTAFVLVYFMVKVDLKTEDAIAYTDERIATQRCCYENCCWYKRIILLLPF